MGSRRIRHTMKRIHDVRYREIPVPSTLADYGIGVEFEAGERARRCFRGRSWQRCRITTPPQFLDHDTLCSRKPRIDWDSNWRCVAFARLPLETAETILTPGMYWDDMCDYFDGIEPDSVSGTVTVTQNTAFA